MTPGRWLRADFGHQLAEFDGVTGWRLLEG